MYVDHVYLFEVRNLGKKYKNQDRFALEKASFKLPSTGLIAIKGKSGSGKSTLLHLLLGLTSPTTGSVFYKGKSLGSFSESDWLRFRRHETSIVFQHYRLIPHLTALQNIALSLQIAGFSKHKARKRAMHLLKRFHLEGCASKKAKVLSGGESQRVAICRSLSLSPSVIFADEPTGALDSKNAMEAMDMLSLISKRALVVLVSHDEELAQRYADRIISLGEGHIVDDVEINKIARNCADFKRNRVHSGNWLTSFVLDHLKQHPGSVVLRYVSSFIGFLSILLCVGFAMGNEPALNQRKADSLGYLSFKITNKEYVEIPSSPLRLVKETRPSLEDAAMLLDNIDGVSIHSDYSYFFPASLPFEHQEKRQEPCRFQPIYDISLQEYGSELVTSVGDGRFEQRFQCVANQEFVNSYGIDVGEDIHVEYITELIPNGTKESIRTSFDFRVSKVVSEFAFLNSPKIYYSYQDLDRYYGDLLLDNAPLRNGRKQSVAGFVASCNGDEACTNFAYVAFAHSLADAEAMMQRIDEQGSDGLQLQSDAHDITVSFLSLSGALVTASFLFMGIAVIALILIIALNAYAAFLSQKRESSILLVLGAKKVDVISIVAIESVLISFSSSILALAASYPLQKMLSMLLEKEFGVSDLIRIPYDNFLGVPFLFISLVFLIGMFLSYFASALPIAIAGRIDLSEALKEE